MCKQCLSPLMLWVWIPLRQYVLDTTLCHKVCQFYPVSSTNKTDCHDITEILLKVALNIITLPLDYTYMHAIEHLRGTYWPNQTTAVRSQIWHPLFLTYFTYLQRRKNITHLYSNTERYKSLNRSLTICLRMFTVWKDIINNIVSGRKQTCYGSIRTFSHYFGL